ncbi:MAG: AMP-binding protein [Methylophaga sp.]|nr:AMP-binding protein [Methylophaga sp.]
MLEKLLINLFLWRFKLPRDVHRYAFKHYSDRILLQTLDRTLTYGELKDRSYRLVAAWKMMGLKKGDIVFTQVKAEEELFEIRTAALELGILLTAFHEAHPAEFLIYAAGEASPKLFIANPDYGQGSVDAFLIKNPEIPVWETGVGKQYEEALSSHEPIQSKTQISASDSMALGFTSGTTGVPKGLVSSYGSAISSLKLMVKNIEGGPSFSENNINLTAIPFVGAGSGLFMPTMISGGTLVVLDVYSPENLVATVKKHGVTRLFVTPSQLIDILEMPESVDNDLETVSHIIYGTAPMPAAKIEEAIKRFGSIFQQGYGQSEVLPPVSMLHSSDHMSGGEIAGRDILSSCGCVVDGVSVRISDRQGQTLPAGAVGEVHVNTPTRFTTYLNPEQNKGVILDDGFFVTGDHGYIDLAGYLHILDRQADLISTDDGLIYPRIVEEEVHDHPAVRECCLVDISGQSILCVSLRNTFKNSSKLTIRDEIMSLLSSRILNWQMPVDIVFLDVMPRSLLGKVLRREVRDKLNSLLTS